LERNLLADDLEILKGRPTFRDQGRPFILSRE
jgi:hypothetical protein